MKKCPECGSTNTETVSYLNASCLICNDCGYDETKALDEVPEERSNQKTKGEYNPYRTGGKDRTKN